LIDSDLDTYQGIQGDITIRIGSEQLRPIVKLLVEQLDCKHLSAITAQQRLEYPDTIDVMYHFWAGIGFSLMLVLPAQSPELPEIFSILPGADFYEREASEMFGIKFIGREDMPPLLLPDGWDQGPPFISKEKIDE
jgi:NADH:ubiquinone oxidoreductase subunit C